MASIGTPVSHPALAGASRFAGRSAVSYKDLAAHTKIKYRQTGQGSATEVAKRDLKAELSAREQANQGALELARARAGEVTLQPSALPAIKQETKTQASTTSRSIDDVDDDGPGSSAAVAAVAAPKQLKDVDLSAFDDADDSFGSSSDSDSSNNGSDDDNDSDSDDSDDEEAELMRELARIKKEKELERQRKEAGEAKAAAASTAADALSANPLLSAKLGVETSIKRRWDDDVVFKNQSRGQQEVKKRFINDVVRSDFHRSFMKKYVR